jgi:hypothetical protein
LRQSFAGFEDDGFVELGSPPDDIDACGFYGANGGLGDLGADTVSGDEGAIVGHISFYDLPE